MKDLQSHVRSVDDLQKLCYDMGDVVLNLFDDDIERMFSYKGDDHQGVACVVLSYKGKYIWLYECFGSCSGCDDWIDGGTVNCTAILSRIVGNINNNIAKDLQDITFPYETDYIDRGFLYHWVEFANRWGFLESSQKKGSEIKKLRELEYNTEQDRIQEEAARNMRLAEEQERKRKLAFGKELMKDLEDSIAFFDNKVRGSWFIERRPAKIRLLGYCVKELNQSVYYSSNTDIDYKKYLDLRGKAIAILISYGEVRLINEINSFPLTAKASV